MPKKILKLFGYLCIVGFLFSIFYVSTVIANTPSIDAKDIYAMAKQGSTILDDQEKLIDSVYVDGGNRQNIDYKDMPENMINAIIAIEDKTFRKHSGFNVWRIFGAIKDAVFSSSSIKGTSTITQQLARNVFLEETKSVRSINRKVSEAYYTILIEKALTKDQIIEAYLNTVYFGNNAYGIQMAASTYFNKDAKDLDLAECVALASMPQAPTSYSLVKNIGIDGQENTLNQDDILKTTQTSIYYYDGESSKKRRELTLKLMEEQGYITKEQREEALAVNLRDRIDISSSISLDTTYLKDYIIDNVISDLMEKYNYSKEEAQEKVYSGGLTIYSTLNTKAQNAIDTAFEKDRFFPKIQPKTNSNGDILNTKGSIALRSYDNYFDDNGNFYLTPDEYTKNDKSITLLAGKRLNFYKTSVGGKTDYSVEFKDLYTKENGILHVIEGGYIHIPSKYKSLDADGNLIISKKFFDDETIKANAPDFLKQVGENYLIPSSCYTLKQSVQQPQAAMVIMDYKTGAIKAMSGGRHTYGSKLYNRALNPRQTGSSIKPLSIYSTAIELGKEAATSGSKMSFKDYDQYENSNLFGDYWTMSSGINDHPIKLNGRDWPNNAGGTYVGEVTMRYAIEQSLNTVPVRMIRQMGTARVIDQLEKFGITTLTETDDNASALALGGFTKGVSPLEMTSAFSTFPNSGKRSDPITYTKVVDRHGKVILENKPKSHKVLDEDVNYIMHTLLRSCVTNGIASAASGSGQITAGKSGTTSDYVDVWFCGYTPQYVAVCWMGNDVNIPLTYSYVGVTNLWANIMKEATAGMGGSFMSMPGGVVSSNGEYYIAGTEKGVRFSYDKNGKTKEEIEEEEEAEENQNQEDEEVNEGNPETLEGQEGEEQAQPPSDEGGLPPQPNPPVTPPQPSP